MNTCCSFFLSNYQKYYKSKEIIIFLAILSTAVVELFSLRVLLIIYQLFLITKYLCDIISNGFKLDLEEEHMEEEALVKKPLMLEDIDCNVGIAGLLAIINQCNQLVKQKEIINTDGKESPLLFFNNYFEEVYLQDQSNKTDKSSDEDEWILL